jgi:catecholate siderophore receptor
MIQPGMKRHSLQLLGAITFSAALTTTFVSAETLTLTGGKGSTKPEVLELPGYVARSSSLYADQVNALKTPTPIIDVPQSLSITSQEEIALRGFDSLGDIVDYTPGVSNTQGEGHRDAIVFRGVRSTADFFVDGVRDDVQYYRPLYNVEQVEILRGPNALFFGRGGTGGVLNRVMKKAQIGQNFDAYSLRLDTFGAGEVQFDGNVGINKNSAFRINAHYETIENHRDFSDGERYGVTPTFTFKLNEATTLDVSYEYLDHDRFIDRGIPTGADGKPVEAFEDIVFGDPDLNESTLEAHVIRALLQHQFSDTLKGNFTASYGDYEKLYKNLYASNYDSATNIVTLDGYLDDTARQNAVLSGNLIGEFETGDIPHTLIFGAEYIDTSSDQNRFNANWSTTGNDTEEFFVTHPLPINGGTGVSATNGPTTVTYSDINDDTRSDLSVYSFYLQDEIRLFEQLQLVLGGRFDSFDIEVDDVLGATQGSQQDEEFSPRGGIVYKPQENISIYASYSKSFLPQSGEQFDNLGNQGLEPDESTNLEAGVKWDFSQGLSLTTSIFQIEQENFEFAAGGGFNKVRVESEITGFEAQLQGRLTDSWFISAGYSYLEGEIQGDPNNPGVEGNRPRELPEHMFSVWNRYQLTEKFGLGLGVIYQDETYISENNDRRLPSYVRVDAAAYYEISEDLRLQLNIENLTDERYFPHAHGNHQVTVGAPIHARLSISGRF